MLQRFRRITSGSSWIPQIDGLRFVAIMCVLVSHSYGEVASRGPRLFTVPLGTHWYTDFLLQGDHGVELFFAISGYILSRPFLREHLLEGHKVKLSAYFMRRITRLEPPYIITVLIYALSRCYATHITFGAELPHTLASMFYVHSLLYPHLGAANFVTWSLEIEIQFYILAPLLASLFRIPNTAVRRFVMVALIVLASAFSLNQLGLHLSPGTMGRIHLSVLGSMQFFLLGFLLADLLEYPRHAPRQHWYWDLIGVASWSVLCFFCHYNTLGIWLMLPTIFGGFLSAFYGKASNFFFRQTLIAVIGGMCYSLYLLHIIIFQTVFRAVKHLQFASIPATISVQMVLLLIPAIIVSAGYFLLVERPCMDPAWPRKLMSKLRTVHQPAVLDPPL